MRAVMISIQPKWCELIASGKKTIEVRKTRPKIDTPFKCYIYCSKSKPYLYKNPNNNELFLDRDLYRGGVYEDRFLSGKVIGEFVCDWIEAYIFFSNLAKFSNTGLPCGTFSSYLIFEDDYKKMCLSYDEVKQYGNGKTLYGWHISDLKIYDKPKELFEFYPTKHKPMSEWTDNDFCQQCKYHQWIGSMKSFVERGIYMREKCTLKKPEPICEYTPPLTRPPQSWCYVEEKENNNG